MSTPIINLSQLNKMVGVTYADHNGKLYKVTAVKKHENKIKKILPLQNYKNELHVLCQLVNGTDNLAATFGYPISLFRNNFKKFK